MIFAEKSYFVYCAQENPALLVNLSAAFEKAVQSKQYLQSGDKSLWNSGIEKAENLRYTKLQIKSSVFFG